MCLDVSNGIHVLGTCRYVFGVTHVPRLEDWPVMPVEHVGFTLVVSAPFQSIFYFVSIGLGTTSFTLITVAHYNFDNLSLCLLQNMKCSGLKDIMNMYY